MKDKFNYIASPYMSVGGHGYGYLPNDIEPFWTGTSSPIMGGQRVAKSNYRNASGNDEFPLAVGSSGSRTEQLKQALIVLGQPVSEDDFGMQTRTALTHLGYPPAVNDENVFNTIILRAYKVGKKKITLTEPEMRALYVSEVPKDKQSTLTFDKWLKRQNAVAKIEKGGKQVFDVLFGWLQLRAKGAGSVGGTPTEQPTDTSGGWFSKTADGSVPTGYIVIGSAVGLGLAIWGVSALIKHSRKSVHVQPNLASQI